MKVAFMETTAASLGSFQTAENFELSFSLRSPTCVEQNILCRDNMPILDRLNRLNGDLSNQIK
jgi:hypothetical protein